MTPALIAALVGAGLFVSMGGGWLVARRGAGTRIASPEEAAVAAETALPGFVVAGAVVGADGGGALAVAVNGRVAAMARRGRRLLSREVEWRSIRSTAEGIVIETGDRQLGDIRLAGVDVLDIRRLAPVGRSPVLDG